MSAMVETLKYWTEILFYFQHYRRMCFTMGDLQVKHCGHALLKGLVILLFCYAGIIYTWRWSYLPSSITTLQQKCFEKHVSCQQANTLYCGARQTAGQTDNEEEILYESTWLCRTNKNCKNSLLHNHFTKPNRLSGKSYASNNKKNQHYQTKLSLYKTYHIHNNSFFPFKRKKIQVKNTALYSI